MRGFWRIFRRSRRGVTGLVILAGFLAIAVVGPVLVGPVDRAGTNLPFLPPSPEHPFGTDQSGRDLFVAWVHGTRVSMVVGIVASLVSMLIGALVGIVAGFQGGRAGGALSRLTEFFYLLPTLVLAVVLATLIGPSIVNVILVIAIASWSGTALVIRSQTLSLRERTFVDRARAYGASGRRLMTSHILPNVMGLILALTTIQVANAIFLETTLSFLGVGDKNTFSWGRMLNEAFTAGALSLGLWNWFVPPGLSVVFVVIAFTLVGQAFDEILNPRLRRREAGIEDDADDQPVPASPSDPAPAPA